MRFGRIGLRRGGEIGYVRCGIGRFEEKRWFFFFYFFVFSFFVFCFFVFSFFLFSFFLSF